MKRIYLPLLACALVLTLAACQPAAVEEAPVAAAATAEIGIMKLPMTTDSAEAKEHLMEGLRAFDVGRFQDARSSFLAAIEADPSFATGHYNAASVSNSYGEFVRHLKNAVANSQGASEAERAMIMTFQRGFENDDEGALAEAMKVVELHPDSPRGWLNVAQAQSALGDYAAERATAAKILESTPGFLPAYFQLANSYVFNEPRDFAQAEANAMKLAELAPDEQNSHDLLGDVHRAQGSLEAAHADYTRAAELAPDNGSPLQQRGHVNSFLGNWEQARADYDRAMELEEPDVAANFGNWRGYVAVYEGKPEDAVAEFKGMIAKVDSMNLGDPVSAKVGYLQNIIIIAGHHGMLKEAAAAMKEDHTLRMARLETTGAPDRTTQESTSAYFEGMLAARMGDYRAARAKAAEFMKIVEADTDPQRNEPAHEILGLAALLEGDAATALAEYEKTNPADPYAKYHLGLACEAAGDDARADEVFADLAKYNFNSIGYALIRADVMGRVAG